MRRRSGEAFMSSLFLPIVTLHAAGLLGVMFVILSVLVVAGRNTGKVSLGDGTAAGEATALLIAIRSHANFAEYVPLTLLVIGLVELHAGPTLMVKLLAGGLVVARVLHPIGMRIQGTNPFRAAGFLLTVVVLAAASVCALLTQMG
jgi:hypothetical protein